mgnify:FL=1
MQNEIIKRHCDPKCDPTVFRVDRAGTPTISSPSTRNSKKTVGEDAVLGRLQRINTGLPEIGMNYEKRKEPLFRCHDPSPYLGGLSNMDISHPIVTNGEPKTSSLSLEEVEA